MLLPHVPIALFTFPSQPVSTRHPPKQLSQPPFSGRLSHPVPPHSPTVSCNTQIISPSPESCFQKILLPVLTAMTHAQLSSLEPKSYIITLTSPCRGRKRLNLTPLIVRRLMTPHSPRPGPPSLSFFFFIFLARRPWPPTDTSLFHSP